MKIDILTLFPTMFKGPFDESIIKRAQNKNLVEIKIHNLRDWAKDKHRTVDGKPYGGGPGMVLRIDIIDTAISNLKTKNSRTILLSAKGKRYNQQKAQELATMDHLVLICGHYEGVDQRIADYVADEVISIGDYVLTGGEPGAIVVVDSVARLLEGVVGDPKSLKEESHTEKGVIEYPQYTRPEEYKSWKVPEVLLSGNHKEINKWRKNSLKKI